MRILKMSAPLISHFCELASAITWRMASITIFALSMAEPVWREALLRDWKTALLIECIVATARF